MPDNQKKRSSAQLSSPSKGEKSKLDSDTAATIEACMEKNGHYFEHHLTGLEEMGRSSESKMISIEMQFSAFSLEFKTFKRNYLPSVLWWLIT